MKLNTPSRYVIYFSTYTILSASLLVALVKIESETAFAVATKLTGIMGPSGFLAWELIIPGLATPVAVIFLIAGVALSGFIGYVKQFTKSILFVVFAAYWVLSGFVSYSIYLIGS